MPVAYDQGSIPRELHICSSSLAGVMQLSMRATLPKVAFLLISAPLRDDPIGEQQAASVTASQTPMQKTMGDVKACGSNLGLRRSPQKRTLVGNPRWMILLILAS